MPYRPFYGHQSTRTIPLALGNHTIRHCQKTAVYRKTPVKCTAVAVYGTADSPMYYANEKGRSCCRNPEFTCADCTLDET